MRLFGHPEADLISETSEVAFRTPKNQIPGRVYIFFAAFWAPHLRKFAERFLGVQNSVSTCGTLLLKNFFGRFICGTIRCDFMDIQKQI